MTPAPVRGVAILDRKDRVLLLETLHCDTSTARIWVEKVLYASVDALDDKIASAITTTNAAKSASMAKNNETEEAPGLYLGQLATQGRLTVHGFMTSVQMRCLVCFEIDVALGKMDDKIARSLLQELSRLYVEETAANPFGTSDQEQATSRRPITFRDTRRLQSICGFKSI